jgi:uncharacterized membrane protein YdbT with pleckstrin-like domain
VPNLTAILKETYAIAIRSAEEAGSVMNLPVELQPNESVNLVVRRHPVYMMAKLAGAGLAAVIPTALLIWLISATSGFDGAIGWIAAIAATGWILIWAVVAYFIWYKHEHDLWVVTNQRLLDVYRSGFFNQRVSSADLVNVQDISIEKTGVLATLFNFGDVRCQTAGAQSSFVLSGIPKPSHILTSLDAARDAARLLPREGARVHSPADTVPESFPEVRPPVSDRIPGSS